MQLVKPFVLASRSPRRLALLRQIGISPLVVPCDLEEAFDATLPYAENALRLSSQKAECAAAGFDDALIVGADTIVVVEGQMLGKPVDRRDAVRMLSLLSGRTHTVYTGFTLLDRPSGSSVGGVESTIVTFRSLPPEEIASYVESGSPMDKAGAYGIQDDYGAVFVTRIEGCFYNVVGFPLSRFYTTLSEFQSRLSGRER